MYTIKSLVLALLAYLTLHTIADVTQNKYIVTFERAAVHWYDRNVYENYELKTYKYNRTAASFNITYTYKIDVTAYKVHVRFFKFAANDYKLTAIQYEVNGCTMFKLGMYFAKSILDHSNMTNCPVKKGTYVIYNAYFDSSNGPPHFPEGNWMLQAELIIGGASRVDVRFYLSIQYLLKRGRQ